LACAGNGTDTKITKNIYKKINKLKLKLNKKKIKIEKN
jgi:hypothetical protein